MRKLMWFSIGFAAACACAAYVLTGQWLFLCALVCLPGIALLWVRSQWAKRIAVLLLGCAVGFAWCYGFDALYLNNARKYDGQVLQLYVEASDYTVDTQYGSSGTGYVHLADRDYPVKYYLNESLDIAPGDGLLGEFWVNTTKVSAQQDSLYYSSSGVYIRLYAEGTIQLQDEHHVPFRYFGAEIRRQVAAQIQEVFPSDAAGFAQALLLGDRSLIQQEQMNDLKTSGIAHIIATSGLHVAIMLSFVYWISGESSRWTAALGIPVMFAFAAVAGFTPSIVRACLMQSLMLLSYSVEKEYDPPTSLAFAALVMLVVNPFVIASVSFQLSVCCIMGIILFNGKISKYLLQEKRLGTGKGDTLKAKFIRFTAASLSVSISTLITTAPLCAYYFGLVSIVGILTNFLTIWVISYIFYGIILAVIAGAIWQPLGQLIAFVVSLPIRYVQGVAGALSDVPFAAVYTQSPYIVCWLVLLYVLLAVFLWCKKKRPVLLCAGVIVSLALAVAASCAEPLLDRYRITMLDVGQGQCILIQSKDKHYMIDCGGEDTENAADTAVQQLYSQGVTELDGLFLTHFDSDHTSGAASLLSRIDVKVVYMPFLPESDSTHKQDILATGCNVEFVRTDRLLEDGNIKIQLYPVFMGKTENKYALCVLCQVEDCDILITGDLNAAGEQLLLQNAQLPPLDILVAGHHGAQDATSLQLLSHTRPSCVLISSGEDNRYNHPSYLTLQKLRMFNITVRRTDLEGTILIRG